MAAIAKGAIMVSLGFSIALVLLLWGAAKGFGNQLKHLLRKRDK